MTRDASKAIVTVGETKTKSASTGVRRTIRNVGVIGLAAAFATPLALPAFASTDTGTQTQGSLAALVETDSQSVTAVTTAGSAELEAARLETAPTTQAELQALRDQLAAEQAVAEQAAADEAAAEETAAAAATTTTSNASSTSSSSSTAASTGAATQAAAGSGSAIANAALAQIGEHQDCTKLVADSLAAVGIGYSGMGSLFNLGPTISQSQATPGDVIYYADGGFGIAHVAIYIGGGQAVHGGWSGGNTVVAGTNIGGTAPVFIDVA